MKKTMPPDDGESIANKSSGTGVLKPVSVETATAKTHEGENSFFARARKMMTVYAQSTGSSVYIHDQNFLLIPGGVHERDIEQDICRCCRNGNCREMHVNAIKEASRRGGSHIYQCELGLLFWTSPVYTDGRFSGALRGTGFLHGEANAEQFSAMCGQAIPAEEFAGRVASLPMVDAEKRVSLAEVLLLCAESLSTGMEDYHEVLRRRAEQQQIIGDLIEELKVQCAKDPVPPRYPLDKERLLIAALRRGDSGESVKILRELIAVLVFSNPNHFRYIQLRTLELAVLISREGANVSNSGYTSMESSSRYLRRIQDSKTIDELIDILHNIVENITEQVASFQGIPHAAALRKAERFIRQNFTRKISLGEIAAVSGLSAPYFSTIFKEEMGENLSKYLNRLRVEKASHLLLETDLSLSKIASACCFEDQSWFSKIFKTYTGLSPGKYRSQGGGLVQEISEHNLSDDYLQTIK